MSNETSAETGVVNYYEMSKAEIERAVTFEEAIGELNDRGIDSADVTLVLNPYETLNKDKDALLERPFLIRSAKFMVDKQTGKEYVNLWVVREDDRLFRVTDGSTGIFAQMNAEVERRLETGHKTPYNYFLVANGLRKSEFGIDKDGNTVELGDPTMVSKAATYYLA
jgi:hypothetical protein